MRSSERLRATPRESTVNIIFFRHGDAEDTGADGTDSGRRITPRGEESNRRIAEQIRAAGHVPDRIVASPLVRAQETARAVAEVLTPGREHETDERLGGGTGVGDIQNMADERKVETLLLVGHEPDFSNLTSRFIGGGSVVMKKSGASCIRIAVVEPGMGELQWLINPAIIPGHSD